MEPTILHIALLPMLVASFVVMVVHPQLVKIARRKHLVDNPNARKLNKQPVPVLGGVGVLFGLLFGIGVTGYFLPALDLPAEVLIAVVVLLYTGVADDILDLSPRLKFVLQIFAVLLIILSAELYIDNLYGLWGMYYLPEWLAVSITLFAGVGIINSINLIDGVDGLCALYAIFVSLFFGLGFVVAGDYPYAILAFATLGGVMPFMLHNVYGTKYKMFLGDGGSLVLGLICVVYVLRQLQCAECAMGGSSIAFAFAVMAVPVCDTLRVMTMRMARGRSPFRPDKSHLHHLFISLGMDHLTTAFCVVALNVVVVAVWLVSVARGMSAEWQLSLTLLVGMTLTWVLYYVVEYATRKRARFIIRIRWAVRRNIMRRALFEERLRRVLDDRT